MINELFWNLLALVNIEIILGEPFIHKYNKT